MCAIGVAVRIEVSDRDSEEVGGRDERPDERDEFVPVEAERLRVADSGQHLFVEDVEVEMQPRRTAASLAAASVPTPAAPRSRTSSAVRARMAGSRRAFSRATSG